MSELISRIAALSPEKRKLFQQLQKKKVAHLNLQRIPRTTDGGSFPLSFAQQRLWFLDQLQPGTCAYNIPTAIRISGQLNIAVLERSLNEIVKRHEALRTTFATVDGQPVQIVSPPSAFTLSLVDLEKFPQMQRETQALQLATEEAQQPFDLARGPLLRVKLLRLDDQEHVLLLTMHHIVADGWCMGVLIREMAVLYEAFSTGKPFSLLELPIQYADFAVWQRQWLQGEVLEAQLSYWKKQLDGAPAVLELPTDRPRPAVSTFRGAHQDLALSKDLSEALTTLSQQQGVTLFMTLLAAFQTLLYRYTGQVDILVGTPIANRNRAEIEGLIGFFVNTLVLRTDMSGNPSFRELLSRVREVALGAYAHQDVPFEQLVEALQPARDLSHTPLFQVMFALQNAPLPSLELANLTLTPLAIESQTAKFDLTLSLQNSEQGLIGPFEYNTDLFDAATIAQMAGHFQTLLEGIVAHPEQRLDDLPLLTAAERQTLLVDWNNTHTDYPLDVCLHQLFEAQVERTPDAVAVVFEEQQLTYRELNNRVNQLAHYLQALGVKPDVLVGICMERSLEMVVGLLGILKAGGAYVPIDPGYPQQRLAFMLEDAQTPVLLTQKHLQERLGSYRGRVVELDSDWTTISLESTDNPECATSADNAAYVIYTSGSTGTPKGVINTHRGICNRLLWMQDAYQLTAADRVLQKTPFSFDVSVWEFLWPLLTGACLVVARPGGHRDSAYLVELIAKQKITTLHFVPSMLQIFLSEEGLEKRSCLRQVICSGEALPAELQERFFARMGGVKLHNLYGPTEAAVDVTYWACQPESEQRSVPIGRPIANTQIYILDLGKKPVPTGVAGELYIGGVGLARGYHNRPHLTASKFIPNPFSQVPGARLYQTGDLARYRSDGNIEFLGRIDYQVKIRGLRIELGEIEAVLSQHPTVDATVVMVREDFPGDKRLVAYVLAKAQPVPSVTELRSYLMEKLPDYMVPGAFVLLESLPLTPNGKVNRQALPVPDQTRPELETTFVTPRNPVEDLLAATWAEVLRFERISIHDNFFELGGYSLLAVQVMSKINQKLGRNLPLNILFQSPTVAGLAALVTENTTFQLSHSSLVPIQVNGTQPPVFCIHPAGGQVMVYQHLAASLGPDQRVYGLQSRALNDPDREHDSIDKMAVEYTNAIRQHQPDGPYYLLGWSMGGVLAVSVVRELERQGQKVAFVGLLDAYLFTNKVSTSEQDPLLDLALVFGGTLADAFLALDAVEQQALRDELLVLSSEERLRRAMVWGQERNLLSGDISLDILQKQVILANIHEQLLKAYHAPVIQAPLHIWWAADRLREGQSRTEWSKYTMGGIYTETASGNHFTLLCPPYCQMLAKRLAERLKVIRES